MAGSGTCRERDRCGGFLSQGIARIATVSSKVASAYKSPINADNMVTFNGNIIEVNGNFPAMELITGGYRMQFCKEK